MSVVSVTVRQLRLNFRAVKRQVEEHGSVVITDNGVPSYQLSVLKSVPPERKPLPDYGARLARQRSRISAEEGRRLHEENRGSR